MVAQSFRIGHTEPGPGMISINHEQGFQVFEALVQELRIYFTDIIDFGRVEQAGLPEPVKSGFVFPDQLALVMDDNACNLYYISLRWG